MEILVAERKFRPMSVMLTNDEIVTLSGVLERMSKGGGGWHNRYSYFPTCLIDLPRTLFELTNKIEQETPAISSEPKLAFTIQSEQEQSTGAAFFRRLSFKSELNLSDKERDLAIDLSCLIFNFNN